MKKEEKIEKVRYRKFFPIDRDSPIFEVLSSEEIILDISKDDGSGEFEVMFHKDACNKYLSADLLIEIVENGKKLIVDEENGVTS
jgi:hypothetical protein